MINISIFGYIGYVYLLFLLYPAYYFYKNPALTFHKLELIIAWLLGFVSLLLAQSLIIGSGLFGNNVVNLLQDFIGVFGVWVLVVGCLILSILVATQSSVDVIFRQCQAIFLKCYTTLKPLLKALITKVFAIFYALLGFVRRLCAWLNKSGRGLLTAIRNIYHLCYSKLQQRRESLRQQEQERIAHLQAMHNLDLSLHTSDDLPPKSHEIHTSLSEYETNPTPQPTHQVAQETLDSQDFVYAPLPPDEHTQERDLHIEVVQDIALDSESFLQKRVQEYNDRYQPQNTTPTSSSQTTQAPLIQEITLSQHQEITQSALNNAYKTAYYGSRITPHQSQPQPNTPTPLDIQAIISNSHQAHFTQAPKPQTPQPSTPHQHTPAKAPQAAPTPSPNTTDIITSLNIQEIPQDTESTPQPTESNAPTIPTQELDTQSQDSISQDSTSHQPTPQPHKAPKVPIIRELDENTALLKNLDFGKSATPINFKLPPTSLLNQPSGDKNQIDEVEIDTKSEILLAKLKTFKIDGDVVRTYTGPIVTTFEFRPAPNVKVSRILNLEDDIALALSAKSIRIQAPVPGKDVVGIEIPNNKTETIFLREILESDLFKSTQSPLTLAFGKDIVGNPFVQDLRKLPHLLIAGTTGSGKSVGINAMILSLLYKNSPDTLKLMMIDPKRVEFSLYSDIPHLITPIITDPKKAIVGLVNAMHEMDRRYEKMKDMRVKEIESYNKKAREEGEEEMQYFVIIIDELADLMQTSGREAEAPLSRIAQMGRACGMHLIIATQRPSVDVVTGTLKGNLPSRISYKVGSKVDSKVILDDVGAASLLGRGDMLFKLSDTIIRLHAPFSTEEEIESVVAFIKSQREPQYDKSFLLDDKEHILAGEDSKIEGDDDMLEQIKRFMLESGNTSSSSVQRRFSIGFNRATNYVEQLEKEGFLSKRNAKGVREIIR